MKRVFISYSYDDMTARKFARFLNEHLPALGAVPVAVSDALEAGDNWQMGITEEINKCSIFICFVERENPNVMFELGYALAKNKKIILVGDFKHLPFDLRSMTYVQREAHPYDILMHVEKYLSREGTHESPYAVDLHDPQRAIKMVLDRPELLDSLGPREFEELVMQWFLRSGLEVEPTMAMRDYGYDLLIHPFRGNRAVVEVKKYKSTSQVPLAIIRQLVGSMALERIPYGIIISTAPFSKSAHYFVKDIQPTILLWTLEDLARMDEMPNKNVDSYASPGSDAG